MSEGQVDTMNAPLDLLLSYESNTNVSCLNCARIMEQLITVQLELKSAEEIITILKEDTKCKLGTTGTTILTSMDVSNPKTSPINGNWNTVYHKNRKLKRTPVENSLQFTSSTYISNRFSPLETLKDQQVEEDMQPHDSTRSPST